MGYLQETGQVFALFYAIVFGGVLNRLGPWSAFWRSEPWERIERFRWRVLLSFVFFTVFPGLYLGVMLYYFGRLPAPRDWWLTAAWGGAIFSSVIIVNSFYRFWVAIVLHYDVAPYSKGKQHDRLHWLKSFEYENYVDGGLWSLIPTMLGIAVLCWLSKFQGSGPLILMVLPLGYLVYIFLRDPPYGGRSGLER